MDFCSRVDATSSDFSFLVRRNVPRMEIISSNLDDVDIDDIGGGGEGGGGDGGGGAGRARWLGGLTEETFMKF